MWYVEGQRLTVELFVLFCVLLKINERRLRLRLCFLWSRWAGGGGGRPRPSSPSPRVLLYTMSSGSAQDVAVEHFLRDIERRSKRLHCAVTGCEEGRPRSDMNLLYRKSRLDWRQRDQEGSKKRWVGEGRRRGGQIYFKILITEIVQAERGSGPVLESPGNLFKSRWWWC